MTTANQWRMLQHARDGKRISPQELVGWHTEWRVDKFHGVPDNYREPEKWARWKHDWERGLIKPNDVFEDAGNLLMTVGATDLWNALVTAGLATPYNSTNAAIAVGDSSTAASAGQTDLQAAAGTKLNAADPSSASNTTPIVVAATYSPTPLVGQVVQCSGFTGAGASAINQTFELSVASGSSITLLNSAGTGAITVTGALVKPINRYIQTVNGAPSVSTNQVQFVAVFASANANHAWGEFATTNSAATTNKQAAPPSPHMANRAVSAMGTKASGAAWTLTESITLA